MMRFSSSKLAGPAARAVAQPLVRVGPTSTAGVAPLSTFVRANISRMLLSTNNPSRTVDISHEKELKRGLTTSGEKAPFIPDNTADPVRAAARMEADALDPDDSEAAERLQEKIGKSQGTYLGGTNRHPEFQTGPVAEQVRMANDRMKEQKTPMDDAVDKASQQTASKQQQGRSSSPSLEDREKVQPSANLGGEQNMRPDPLANPSAQVEQAWEKSDPFEKMQGKKEEMDKQPIDYQHVQPGTLHLQGTKDNFDNDPAVSIGQMQDAARSAKETVEQSTVGQAMHDVKQAIKDSPMRKEAKEAIKSTAVGQTLKEMKDAAKSTMQDAKVKAKEFITGEREVEKPDETKSEVRTSRGSSRRDQERQQQNDDDKKRKQQGQW